MAQVESAGEERRVRRWRSVTEKRQIVELTFEPGASVALVARAHGVNANQVFKWRRAFERGERVEPGAAASMALLPVTLSAPCEPAAQEREPAASTDAIHIELPGRALISVEGRADVVVLRTILESLRK